MENVLTNMYQTKTILFKLLLHKRLLFFLCSTPWFFEWSTCTVDFLSAQFCKTTYTWPRNHIILQWPNTYKYPTETPLNFITSKIWPILKIRIVWRLAPIFNEFLTKLYWVVYLIGIDICYYRTDILQLILSTELTDPNVHIQPLVRELKTRKKNVLYLFLITCFLLVLL